MARSNQIHSWHCQPFISSLCKGRNKHRPSTYKHRTIFCCVPAPKLQCSVPFVPAVKDLMQRPLWSLRLSFKRDGKVQRLLHHYQNHSRNQSTFLRPWERWCRWPRRSWDDVSFRGGKVSLVCIFLCRRLHSLGVVGLQGADLPFWIRSSSVSDQLRLGSWWDKTPRNKNKRVMTR